MGLMHVRKRKSSQAQGVESRSEPCLYGGHEDVAGTGVFGSSGRWIEMRNQATVTTFLQPTVGTRYIFLTLNEWDPSNTDQILDVCLLTAFETEDKITRLLIINNRQQAFTLYLWQGY